MIGQFAARIRDILSPTSSCLVERPLSKCRAGARLRPELNVLPRRNTPRMPSLTTARRDKRWVHLTFKPFSFQDPAIRRRDFLDNSNSIPITQSGMRAVSTLQGYQPRASFRCRRHNVNHPFADTMICTLLPFGVSGSRVTPVS